MDYCPVHHGRMYSAPTLLAHMSVPQIGTTNNRQCLISRTILFEYPIKIRVPRTIITDTAAYIRNSASTNRAIFEIPVVQTATLHAYPGTPALTQRYILALGETEDSVVDLMPWSLMSTTPAEAWPTLEEPYRWLDDESIVPRDRHCMASRLQFIAKLNVNCEITQELLYEYRISAGDVRLM